MCFVRGMPGNVFFFCGGAAAGRRCYTEKFWGKCCQRCERHIYADDDYAGTMGEDLDDDPPFDFDKWFSSKNPSEQERLNLIVMNYFNSNNDILDPVESNYHLEAIAAEYDLMQHGEDTKFIQHMTEGPVELGRLTPDDSPTGRRPWQYGIPIKYDPNDRADIEMKYTSSDVFEVSFDLLLKDQRMAPQWMRAEEPVEIEEDLPEVRVNENPPQGSACCEDLIAAMMDLDKRYGSTSLLLDHDWVHDGTESCEDAADFLDSSISYGKYLVEDDDYWREHGPNAQMEWLASDQGQLEAKVLAEMREIKQQYEMCKGTEGSFGNEDMGFYASEDPFEIAWDMVIKMPIRPGSLHQKNREYSYFNPKRKAKQFMDQIPPLRAVPIDEGDESDDDQLSYEAIYDHDDGFSHTPATIVGPEGIIAERVDTPDSSEIIAGREDKRVWGDPLSQRREWWLQGPHGDLYARRGDGKGNVAMEEGNQYRIEEGNLQGKDREKLMEYLEMLSTMMGQHGDQLILGNDVRMMPNPDLERKS